MMRSSSRMKMEAVLVQPFTQGLFRPSRTTVTSAPLCCGS